MLRIEGVLETKRGAPAAAPVRLVLVEIVALVVERSDVPVDVPTIETPAAAAGPEALVVADKLVVRRARLDDAPPLPAIVERNVMPR